MPYCFSQVQSRRNQIDEPTLVVRYSKAPLEMVLDAIEEQSEFYFLYNEKLIDVNTIVYIDKTNVSISELLDILFSETDITYTIIDQKIILVPKNISSVNRDFKISGIVTDQYGNGLPGVNIVEKGTQNGTITDLDGQFNIRVKSMRTTLGFSFLGFLSMEIKLKGRSSIVAVLEEDIVSLDEVIITALGIRREEKALGYSVQKLSGEGLQKVKGTNLSTSLTGKISGLLIANTTEFASLDSVHIRGETPLLVIDGIPYGNVKLRDIPPDDIEEMSFLKGATASALYGYRGQSGAILINTKRGFAQKGTQVNLNLSTMFTVGFLAIPEMQSTYGRLVHETNNTYISVGDGSWGPPMEGQLVNQWNPGSKSYQLMPYLPVGKNNFKYFLEQGYVANNSISIVQQSEKSSFRSSLNWLKNKGIYPNSTLNKIVYTIGGTIKLDKLSIESNMSYNKHISPNVGFNGYRGYDPMYTLLVWSAPDWDIRLYKDYWIIPNEVQNSSYNAGLNNPYFDRYERIHSKNREVLNGFVNLSYSFLPNIKLSIRSGFDIYSDYQVVRISLGSFHAGGNATVLDYGKEIWGDSQIGSYNIGQGRGLSLNNDIIFTANKSFGDFRIDGLLGGTVYVKQDQGIQAFTQDGLTLPAYYSLKASVSPLVVISNVRKLQDNSVFGRTILSWKSLFFIEGSLRTDWSSTFYGNTSFQTTRSYSYPSVSSSFLISELLNKFNKLSLWKLRASWTSAKIPASPYAINQVYSISPLQWGNLSSASLSGSIRSTNVLPESSSTYEVGSALHVFDNRMSLDVAYYNKRMYNFLRKANISPMTGYSSNYMNIDEDITRRGVEVAVVATPVMLDKWNWTMALNWSKYARYYTKVDPEFSADKTWVQVGERADAYISYDFQRDSDGNIIHNAGLPLLSKYPSLFGYRDPNWIWGIESILKYKNYSLRISFDGRVGGLAKTITEMYMWRTGNHPESVIPERYLDATEPGGHYIGNGVKVVSGEATYDTYGNITSDTRVFDQNDVPVLYETYLAKTHSNSAWDVSPSPIDIYSTTFFKIREVALTYDLPEKLNSKIMAKKTSVSLIGQNLFLWAKDFKFSDPDIGSEDFSDPSVRYIGINFNITF